MVVSIGHTLEKETSVGIYRSRLSEWMFKGSIVANTQTRTTTTTCTVVITTNDSDDSGRWQYNQRTAVSNVRYLYIGTT
jgi:hypothetical protein